MHPSFDFPPRTVKPRNRTPRSLPVIAVAHGETLAENGELGTVEDLTWQLPALPPTLFSVLGAADLLSALNKTWLLRDPKHWQWRASSNERDIVTPNGLRVAARVSTIVHYCGFKGGNYHKLIDPVSMYGHGLSTVWPGDDDQLVKLMQWATALRDFCDGQGLDVRPTMGGISAQLLTDSRFYPHARRKVPAATNASTRKRLPGNHYFLNVQPSPSQTFTAYYLDQHRAHHHHAKTLAFPDSNHLYAHGRFTDLETISFPDTTDRFCGLYCLDLRAPKRHPSFGWINDNHLEKQFVYSNELPHLRDLGYGVIGVRAAWGSLHRDEGLGRYACWCEEQLDQYDDAPWLKPLLLSAYGVLATRPKIAESVFRLARGGDAVQLFTGKHRLNGRRSRGRVKLEPRIANVLHRGMIEAATRSESVGLAQWLDWQDQRVLSIYADAVIVQANDDKPLPSLPTPWRLKQELTHLQFINQQAFTSNGMTKLPGVGRELASYRQHRTPGHAPRVVQTEALTGKAIQTTRRI